MVILFWWVIPIVIVAMIAALLANRFWRKNHKPRHQKRTSKIANTAIYTQLASYKSAVKRYKTMLALMFLAILITFTSSTFLATRPATITVYQPEQYNRDIMLCLDVSNDMVAEAARLTQVFATAAEQFRGERIGVTAWDTSSVVIFPLTDDYEFIKERLDTLTDVLTGMGDGYEESFSYEFGTLADRSRGSSLVGNGLASCVGGFDSNSTERSQSIILTTNNVVQGEQLLTIVEAAQLAKNRNIRVYGLNPKDSSRSDESESRYQEQYREYRQAILMTGGSYYKMQVEQSDMTKVAEEIKKQDTTRFKGEPQLVKRDKPFVPAIIALVGIVSILLISWRLRI